MSSFLMLLMTVIENPALIYYTINEMLHSRQRYVLLYLRRGVMVKAIDCGIVVSEFVLQSRYYVLFRANTLGKGMNPQLWVK